jgi:hypothetical protein
MDYRKLDKERNIARKKYTGEHNNRTKLKRSFDQEASPSNLSPEAISVQAFFTPIPISTVALYEIGTMVSILSDTSERGYKCIKINGKITAVYRSDEGTHLYDVHKIIDGRTRKAVQENELEYLKGYSANDYNDIHLEPRDTGENIRQQLKRKSEEIIEIFM